MLAEQPHFLQQFILTHRAKIARNIHQLHKLLQGVFINAGNIFDGKGGGAFYMQLFDTSYGFGILNVHSFPQIIC